MAAQLIFCVLDFVFDSWNFNSEEGRKRSNSKVELFKERQKSFYVKVNGIDERLADFYSWFELKYKNLVNVRN